MPLLTTSPWRLVAGLMGWLFSLIGDYNSAYLLASLVSFVAMVSCWSVRLKGTVSASLQPE